MNAIRRKLGTTVLVAAAFLSLVAAAACGGGNAGAGGGTTYKWKLAETHPKDYPTTKGDIWFADEVRKRSKGRIDIKVFPNHELGEERSVIEQVQLGAIQMTRVSSSPMSEFVPAWGVFSLPYIFDNDEHLWRFLDSAQGQKLLEDLRTGKFMGLTYYDAGARNFYTVKNPVKTPKDLAGLNIRVISGAVNADMIQAMGGSPIAMDFGEVYSGLQTGVVDGAENNEPSYMSAKHNEVAKFYTRDAHQRIPEVLLVNVDLWDKLSDADKQLLRDVAKESVAVQRKAWDAEVKKSIDEMKSKGITVTDVDIKLFQDAVKDMVTKARGKYAESMDAIDSVR